MLSYVISVTLLTLAVIVLRAIFRNKMSSRLVYALWLAVLLRLVLPFDLISIDRVGVDYLGKIESAAGYEIVLAEGGKTEEKPPKTEGKPIVNTPVIENIASGNKEPVFNSGSVGEQTGEVQLGNSQTGEAYIPEISTDKSEIGEVVPSESGVTGSIHSEKEPAEIESTGKPSTVIPSVPQVDAGKPSVDPNEEVPDMTHPSVTDGASEKISVSVKDVLNTVWFAGAAITASVFAVSWAVFSVKLVRSRTLLTRSGKTCVYVSDRIASPCVCGIIPKIYVTPEARDSENLSTVILHERVHVSHGDVIWNVLRIAAVSVFWYNPVIWAATILSKRDAEFACDEATALKLEDRSKLEYARMIVDMTPAKKNYAVSFAGGPIKERVLKLTREHKNKIIVAAVVVLVIGICCAATFIGMNYVGGHDGGTTTETEKGKETENKNEPDLTVPAFEVYEATEENIAKYAPQKYDVSGSEYNFSLIIVPSRDVKNFKINRLNWNEELLVESEEVIEKVGNVKAGDAMLITTDSVEIIGYVGISYVDGGKTVRYYPATSGKDGSAILVEIGSNLLSAEMLYPGAKLYEVTVSEEVTLADVLFELMYGDNGSGTEVLYSEHKVVTVRGLSVPVYLEFEIGTAVKSVTVNGHTAEIIDKQGLNSPSDYSLTEYGGAVIFTDKCNSIIDTWVFTEKEVTSLVTKDGISTELTVTENGLEYTRYSLKFHGWLSETAPLDVALSRDEFCYATGKASVENGNFVLAEPEVSKTIGEAYDLDEIFANYSYVYNGYSSADEVIERNRRREAGEEEPFTESSVTPTQNHVGTWRNHSQNVTVIEVTDGVVKFSAGRSNIFDINATAVLKDGAWKFTEDSGTLTDEEKVKGSLVFTDTSVTVIYDYYGRFRDYCGYGGDKFTLTSKETKDPTGARTIYGRIETCSGRNDVYSDSYVGTYELVFTAEGNYSVNETVEVCTGGCQPLDYAAGYSLIAEYGADNGWEMPVKVYKFLDNTNPETYVNNMRTAVYVFDMKANVSEGIHFELTVTRYDEENPTTLLDNEQELLDEIAKSWYISFDFRDGNLITDPYREIPADQRHVGSWLYSDISLSITSVTDDAVAFSLYQGKGFSYSAIAVLKDGEYVFGHGISPYTHFSDYYGKTDDSGITGKLIFGEASVKVIADGKFFFNDGLDLTYTSSTGHGGSIGLPDYYTEDRWLLTSESVYDTQEDIRNLLKEKGWFYYKKYSNFYGIDGCRGDPNGVDLWGLEITPYDPDYKTPYYTIIGSRGSVSVAVRFAYEKETDSCSVVDVYYADRFGNLLAGEELLSVTHGKTGLDAVLDPSDTALVGFFDSKGPAEKLDGERFEGEENYTDSISPEKIAAMDAFAKENAVIPEELPKFQSDSIYVYPPELATRAGRFSSEYLNVNEIQKFRYSYFAEPTFLYPLVSADEICEWYDKVIASDSVNFVATDEMYTVSFVKYFEIPKEKFIEAQNEYRAKILPLLKSYGISTGNENYEEIPADIVYTFDKLIIDKYFWRYYADASDKSTELKSEHIEMAKTDIRYEFIRSLITKDVSALAKLARYDDAESKDYEKQLAGISTVVFGGYHVFEDMDYEGQLRFGFTVNYSEFDPLPPGKYEMDLSRGIFEPTVTVSVRGGTYMTEYTKRDEWFFVENIITSWAGSDFTSQSSSPSLALFYLYEKANGLEVRGGEAKLTLDELHEIARSVYDDPDFKVNTWPFDLVKGEDGGEEYYKVRGMGGNVIFYDILSRGVNGDTITYTVRYFSDHLQLGSACVVQYVIEKTDSPYGFILRDIRKLESSEFEIFSAGM